MALNPKEDDDLEEGEIREDPSQVDKETTLKIINEHKQRKLLELEQTKGPESEQPALSPESPVVEEGILQPYGDKLYFIKPEDPQPSKKRGKKSTEQIVKKKKVEGQEEKATPAQPVVKKKAKPAKKLHPGQIKKPLKTDQRKGREIAEPKKEICKFYLDNRCTFENCKFSHNLKSLPCKYYHVLGRCTHGDKCKFSHDPMKPENYPKFIQGNEQYIEEVYAKHQLKPPVAEYYLAELKRRDELRQQENMQNAMLPPVDTLSTLPGFFKGLPTTFPSTLPPAPQVPSYSRPPPYPVYSQQPVPYYQPYPQHAYGPGRGYYPPPPPPIPSASAYYQNIPSVFAEPPTLGPVQAPSPPVPQISQAPPPKPSKPLSLKEKLERSGIIKKEVKKDQPKEGESGSQTAESVQPTDPRKKDKKLTS